MQRRRAGRLPVTTAETAPARPRRLRWVVAGGGRELLLAALLAVLAGIFAFRAPNFLDPENLQDVARNIAEVGLLALPQTLVILTGGIDISVGSIMGLTAVALGAAFDRLHWPFAGACGAALLAGVFCGLFNGAAIGPAGMPALVVTLATLAIYRGLAIGFSGGQSVSDFPDSSGWLGQGMLGPLPHQFLLLCAVALLTAAFLYKTPTGRFVFAIGWSETVSRLAGIRVDRIRVLLYSLSGAAAGLATVVHVSRNSAARPDAGLGIELDVISAVVLGGADVAGGEGGLAGTLLALLILGVLHNGLDLMNFPAEGQSIVVGGLLVGAIALDRVRSRRARTT